MQGGRFDHADRLFHSMPSTWANCLHGSSDVKELTPEFFCQPEVLRNAGGLPLGRRQVRPPQPHSPPSPAEQPVTRLSKAACPVGTPHRLLQQAAWLAVHAPARELVMPQPERCPAGPTAGHAPSM